MRRFVFVYLLCFLALRLFGQSWTGHYLNQEQAVQLQLKQNAAVLSGEIVINGEKANVSGKVTGNTAKGELKDEQDTFTFDARLDGETLTLSFTSPKLLFIPITLVFQRQKNAAALPSKPAAVPAPPAASGPNTPTDPRVIGTWRYTEVMSSGSGDNYFSMATDYFLQLDAQGNCATWTGKSGGGGANSSIVGNGATIERGHYKTTNGQLLFIDPATKQQAGVKYSVDATRLLLSGNGQKKVYERIQ